MRKVKCGSTTYVFQEYRPQYDVEFPTVPTSDSQLEESAEWWADYMDRYLEEQEAEDPEPAVSDA